MAVLPSPQPGEAPAAGGPPPAPGAAPSLVCSAAEGRGAAAFAWSCPELCEAVKLFEAGNYSAAKSAAKQAAGSISAESLPGSPVGGRPASAESDEWRATLDDLAIAYEDTGDLERAETTYLRMLAWHEGSEHFQMRHLHVAEQLFKKSPSYKTFEDATWFLKGLKPGDGHAIPEVVGLLALGEEVASKGAVAVWTLALKAEHRPEITESGGLELVTKAIMDFPDNAELQAAGCGAVRLLCTGHSLARRNREALVGLRCAEALLAALRMHRHDAEVQREACGALRHAASRHPAGARRVLDGGGLRLCLEAIANCPDEAVGDAACHALAAMHCAAAVQPSAEGVSGAVPDAEVQAAWQAKLRREREWGLGFCAEQLKIYMAKGDRIVLQSLLSAVRILLEDGVVRPRALTFVELAITCMQRFPGHGKLQVPACGILWLLCWGHPDKDEAVAKAGSAGGLVALCQAMRDLPCHAELLRLAVGATHYITLGNDHHKTIAVRAGGIPAVITAMSRFPKDAEMQEQGIAALTCLCDTLGRAVVCARLGGVEVLVAALRRHGSDGHIAELCCIALCMLCDDPQLRQQVVRCGALAAAAVHSRSAGHSEPQQRWVAELIKEMSEGGFGR